MVAQFAHRSNGSDPCQGVDEYNAGRPDMPSSIRNLNLATWIFLTIGHIILISIHWAWRRKPRFIKVRPFELSIVPFVGFFLFQTACMLAYVTPMPCALTITLYIMATSLLGALTTARGVALALETNYAAQAATERLVHDDSSHTSWQRPLTSRVSHLVLLVLIILGWVKIRSLDLATLVAVKHSYSVMMIVLLVPAVLSCVIIIGLSPPYQTCWGCDVYLELFVGVCAQLVVYIFCVLQLGRQVYTAARKDETGVVFELVFIAGGIGSTSIVVHILMLVDPNGIQYRQEFNWSWLFFFNCLAYYWVGSIHQFYMQWRQDRSRSTIQVATMEQLLSDNPEMKKEFIEYAARCYVSESLNFLEDISMFKSLYYEKADSWRLAKFKSLVDTYILFGARMEVNIPFVVRSHIEQAYIRAKQNQAVSADTFVVFDDAVREVHQMIHQGAWTDFLSRRNGKQQHASAKLAIVPVASSSS
jgi:hypothetical protein